LTKEYLKLSFGIFTWKISVKNIKDCYFDELSLWRIGGAGIHFTLTNKRYRAMFNFLEHRRIVIVLKRKKGLVDEVAFSTKRPEEIKRLINSNKMI